MCTFQKNKWTKLTIWYTPWRCRMTSSSCFDWQKVENLRREWVELFSIYSSPFLLSICCVACNRSLKIRAWPRKKKINELLSLLACSSKTNVLIDLIEFCEKKKRWEGDNNSVVPVIKISPLMALALVVVIRSKKRVTTSSSDPFNKIFRRSVVCLFFLYTLMPELLYTKDFCNSFIHCVWKFFFST